MSKALQHGRARQAWPLLVRRASAKVPYTYGELCGKLDLHPRVASYFLGVIQAYCKERRLPPLQALAVSKRTGLPGAGYYGSAKTKTDHERALLAVSGYSWPTKAPF